MEKFNILIVDDEVGSREEAGEILENFFGSELINIFTCRYVDYEGEQKLSAKHFIENHYLNGGQLDFAFIDRKFPGEFKKDDEIAPIKITDYLKVFPYCIPIIYSYTASYYPKKNEPVGNYFYWGINKEAEPSRIDELLQKVILEWMKTFIEKRITLRERLDIKKAILIKQEPSSIFVNNHTFNPNLYLFPLKSEIITRKDFIDFMEKKYQPEQKSWNDIKEYYDLFIQSPYYSENEISEEVEAILLNFRRATNFQEDYKTIGELKLTTEIKGDPNDIQTMQKLKNFLIGRRLAIALRIAEGVDFKGIWKLLAKNEIPSRCNEEPDESKLKQLFNTRLALSREEKDYNDKYLEQNQLDKYENFLESEIVWLKRYYDNRINNTDIPQIESFFKLIQQFLKEHKSEDDFIFERFKLDTINTIENKLLEGINLLKEKGLFHKFREVPRYKKFEDYILNHIDDAKLRTIFINIVVKKNKNINSPIVFISHAMEDEYIADSVVEIIETNGLTSWVDNRDLHEFPDWKNAIKDTILKKVDYVVVLNSKALSEKAERYINYEIYCALDRQKMFLNNRFIIPFIIDDATLYSLLESNNILALNKRKGQDETDLVKIIYRDWGKRIKNKNAKV